MDRISTPSAPACYYPPTNMPLAASASATQILSPSLISSSVLDSFSNALNSSILSATASGPSSTSSPASFVVVTVTSIVYEAPHSTSSLYTTVALSATSSPGNSSTVQFSPAYSLGGTQSLSVNRTRSETPTPHTSMSLSPPDRHNTTVLGLYPHPTETPSPPASNFTAIGQLDPQQSSNRALNSLGMIIGLIIVALFVLWFLSLVLRAYRFVAKSLPEGRDTAPCRWLFESRDWDVIALAYFPKLIKKRRQKKSAQGDEEDQRIKNTRSSIPDQNPFVSPYGHGGLDGQEGYTSSVRNGYPNGRKVPKSEISRPKMTENSSAGWV